MTCKHCDADAMKFYRYCRRCYRLLPAWRQYHAARDATMTMVVSVAAKLRRERREF